MEEYAPPSDSPPPKASEMPAGWAACWNEKYKEWFYVNVHTKQSQWEKPTAPALPLTDGHDHDKPPPGYEPGSGPAPTDVKKNPYHEDRPAVGGSSIEDDAKLATRLQAEEDAKEKYPQELPPRKRDKGKVGGFLGKLFGKAKAAAAAGGYGGHSPQPQQQGYYQAPPQGYGYQKPQGHYQPQQQYAGYANQGPPMVGYGGSPGFGQQRPQKRPGMGGMGMGLAGGALGLGAGMLGGALIADAVHDHDHEAYMEGYADGQDNDFGGGDFDGDF